MLEPELLRNLILRLEKAVFFRSLEIRESIVDQRPALSEHQVFGSAKLKI